MRFMQEFVIVTPGALQERWAFQRLRRKAHGGIFPGRGGGLSDGLGQGPACAGRESSGGTVPALRLGLAEVHPY